MKILLTDDDEMIRETLEDALVDAGYNVVTAANGRDALDIMKQNKFDLLITDIIMPFTEGIEVIAKARQENPDMKILAISGGGRSGFEEFLKIAGKIGSNDTIKKPFKTQELIDKIKQL